MNNESAEERARRLGVPLVQSDPLSKAAPTDPVLSVCGTCNQDLRKSTNVGACPRTDCPAKLSK